MEYKKLYKALLIPINSKKEIFVQDRRGYKPPDWGFFGGSIEMGESPTDAVIREANEELTIDLTPNDLLYLGEFYTEHEAEQIERHLFLYQTNTSVFTVREGRGGCWVSVEKAQVLLHQHEYFTALWEAVEKVLP